MNFIFPEEAIEFLRRCQYDPAATVSYELISGGLIWSDENYPEFLVLCRAKGCLAYGLPFAYRSSLIREQPYEKYRSAWDELWWRCPEWIGFRPERTTPSHDLQEFLRQSEEGF